MRVSLLGDEVKGLWSFTRNWWSATQAMEAWWLACAEPLTALVNVRLRGMASALQADRQPAFGRALRGSDTEDVSVAESALDTSVEENDRPPLMSHTQPVLLGGSSCEAPQNVQFLRPLPEGEQETTSEVSQGTQPRLWHRELLAPEGSQATVLNRSQY